MTTDGSGQGLIDFTEMFSPEAKAKKAKKDSGLRRRKLKPSEAVPEKELKDLDIVRLRSGFNCKQVADVAGLTQNFVYKALHGDQLVCREDFHIIFDALAKLVFRKIIEA